MVVQSYHRSMEELRSWWAYIVIVYANGEHNKKDDASYALSMAVLGLEPTGLKHWR